MEGTVTVTPLAVMSPAAKSVARLFRTTVTSPFTEAKSAMLTDSVPVAYSTTPGVMWSRPGAGSSSVRMIAAEPLEAERETPPTLREASRFVATRRISLLLTFSNFTTGVVASASVAAGGAAPIRIPNTVAPKLATEKLGKVVCAAMVEGTVTVTPPAVMSPAAKSVARLFRTTVTSPFTEAKSLMLTDSVPVAYSTTPGVMWSRPGAGSSSVRMIAAEPLEAERETPPTLREASRLVATSRISLLLTFSNFTTGVVASASVAAGGAAPIRIPNTVAPKLATEKLGKVVCAAMVEGTVTVTPPAVMSPAAKSVARLFRTTVTSPFTEAKSLMLTDSVPVAYSTTPGVMWSRPGAGSSSVRMIAAEPLEAERETPPTLREASRLVATSRISLLLTFSNFTTGVVASASVAAGGAAPIRIPNTVAPKFATEKLGKVVWAAMVEGTVTVTPPAVMSPAAKSIARLFRTTVTSPFTEAKSLMLTDSVPVAYSTTPGVMWSRPGAGSSSVRMIAAEPLEAERETPPTLREASRFVATSRISLLLTFWNFTTGVVASASVAAGGAAPIRIPNTVAPKLATEKLGKVVCAAIAEGTVTVTPPAVISPAAKSVARLFRTTVTSPFTEAKSLMLTDSVPVAYSTTPGVMWSRPGAGSSSVRMIAAEPLEADSDTPPTLREASRLVATSRISLLLTFSNFTTGVVASASVAAGGAAPIRIPNTVAPKFATEKLGKVVWAAMVEGTVTVTPPAVMSPAAKSVARLFRTTVTSPFTEAKSLMLTDSVPVAYSTTPGVMWSRPGAGSSSVRMIAAEPLEAERETPPTLREASRLVATSRISLLLTFSNFTTGVVASA